LKRLLSGMGLREVSGSPTANNGDLSIRKV
jgi:hypothetical protein